MSLILEAAVILVLVLVNGLFAMSEAALISARSARLQEMATDGDVRARSALDLLEEPNLFLSTVQVGITLVGVLAGAFGGATIAVELAGFIGRVPVLDPYARVIGVGAVVVVIAYLSLILGELVPKRLALNSPERVASSVARPMRLLSRLTAPVVSFLSLSTNAVLRVLRVQPGEEPPVTEAEIGILIEQGARAGVFEEAEKDIVERVFRLGDLRVTALMTPRPEVAWLDLESPSEENQRRMRESAYSRFPVCRGQLDEVAGVVRAKDLLVRHLDEEGLDLQKDLQSPLFVPESLYALQALESFRETGQHIALVADEYGELEGVVTLNDVLEALVGVLPSLDEPAGDSEAVRREDGSWLLDGALPINRFKEILDIKELPGERTGNYQTLAGFVMTYLKRLPAVADRFEWEGIVFEVADMDGYRLDKVIVTPAAEPEDGP
ncbi:MAG: hemolysin family protein [Rubrobacteraceae bacterium]